MGPVAAGISVAIVVLVIGAAVYSVMRNTGRGPGGRLWATMMGSQALICGVCVWAFASHRPALAIAVLVAAFVAPNLVLIGLRQRRGR